MTQRAQPLPPSDRRQAIVESVTPLIMDRGVSVTTAELARAAGVAEGTIFRVFPDKQALIHEVVAAALDPQETLAALSKAGDGPLVAKLEVVVEALIRRSNRIHELMSVLPSFRASPEQRKAVHSSALRANTAIFEELTAILSDHRDDIVVEPEAAAAALRGLIFAVHSPFTAKKERLEKADALKIFTRGISEKDPIIDHSQERHEGR